MVAGYLQYVCINVRYPPFDNIVKHGKLMQVDPGPFDFCLDINGLCISGQSDPGIHGIKTGGASIGNYNVQAV